jgi:hypothetical protein
MKMEVKEDSKKARHKIEQYADRGYGFGVVDFLSQQD